MLKTSSTKSAKPRKGVVRVSADRRAGRDGNKIVDDEVDDEVNDKIGKKDQNLSKSKSLFKSKKTESGFLTFGARMAFIKLRQGFVKALILYHFDPERYI